MFNFFSIDFFHYMRKYIQKANLYYEFSLWFHKHSDYFSYLNNAGFLLTIFLLKLDMEKQNLLCFQLKQKTLNAIRFCLMCQETNSICVHFVISMNALTRDQTEKETHSRCPRGQRFSAKWRNKQGHLLNPSMQ